MREQEYEFGKMTPENAWRAKNAEDGVVKNSKAKNRNLKLERSEFQSKEQELEIRKICQKI